MGGLLATHEVDLGMTKSELIDAVARRTRITKSRAEQLVNCIFDTMTSALERGDGIEIRGFGSFTVRSYKGYQGRNPRTGQTVAVSPKRLPFFKVGKELKEIVNEGRGDGDGAPAAPSNGVVHRDGAPSGRPARRGPSSQGSLAARSGDLE
jgi:integration host factor subunit beta